MTGIAFGNLNIPKISMGNTEIKKVSMGDTLIWPAAAAEVDRVAVIESTSSSLVSGAPFPASAQVGDAIVFIERCTNGAVIGTPPVTAYPPGYTASYVVSEVYDTLSRLLASVKILDEADITAAAPIVGMTSSNGTRQRIALLVRGYNNNIVTPITQASFSPVNTFRIGNGDLTPLTMPITGTFNQAAPTILSIGVYASSGAVNPRTWSGPTPVEVQASTSTLMYIKYIVNYVGLSDFTIDMADEGDSNTLYALNPYFQ
jgi:hypothetical protein